MPNWFWRDLVIPFLATRLALCLVAWLGFELLPLPSASPVSWEVASDGAHHPSPNGAPACHAFANMWSRWDAGWYLEIAKHGYHYQPGQPSSTAFFPLYPYTVRLLHALFFLPADDLYYLTCGIVLSGISLIAALTYFYRLLRLDYSQRIAARTLLVLLLFPTSFFFSCVYSESMFLALTISSFYYARERYWLIAVTLAALSTLCRSQGVILTAPLLVEYLSRCNYNWRLVKWKLLSLLLIPVPLVAYGWYLQHAFGNWLVLFDSQRPWGRRFLAPWHTLSWVLRHLSGPNDWIDLIFLLLLGVAGLCGLRQLRLSYTAYVAVALIFFSCWGMLGSIPRFILVVFPIFIVIALAAERSRAFRLFYYSISTMLAGIFFLMYTQWQWIA